MLPVRGTYNDLKVLCLPSRLANLWHMREFVDTHFLDEVRALPRAADRPANVPRPELTGERCLELFDAQLGSRHLDLAARELQAAGKGFYTIGSSGHEGNAAVAAALRADDPALLHYRSAAFYCARAAFTDPT